MLPATFIDDLNDALKTMSRGLEFQLKVTEDKYRKLEQRLSRLENQVQEPKPKPPAFSRSLSNSQEFTNTFQRTALLMSPKPYVTFSPGFFDKITPTTSSTSSEVDPNESIPKEEPFTPTKTRQDRERENDFRAAAKEGRQGILRALLEAGVDPNARSESGYTALHLAIHKGQLDCVKILIDAGAHVNDSDKFGQTPLIKASSCGSAECLRLLLAAGAKISLKDHNGRSALHAASAWGHSDCVQLLLDAGARVGERDNGGRTPLHVAAASNRPETVHALLMAGADKNAKANDGKVPMDGAVSEEVKYLLWK